jgi:hypothetical protein
VITDFQVHQDEKNIHFHAVVIPVDEHGAFNSRDILEPKKH